MDYEKKYKDALEKAKEVYNRKDATDGGKLILESMFPELKESEDERIRKALIELVRMVDKNPIHQIFGYGNIKYSDMIAWLEQQGNDYNRLVEEMKERKKLLSQEKEKATSINDKLSLGGRIAILEELLAFTKEKQGEQKPNNTETKFKVGDKVESKFKVGDWIINNDKRIAFPTQILKIEEYGYITSCGYTSFDKVKIDYHLWTIQDAKDGDVLYHKSPLTDIEYIVMSRGINGYGNADSYFRYNSEDGFNINVPSVFNIKSDDICPATKEQRDLLFQKMKEAGYEWDAEKKELKKLVKQPLNIVWKI